MPKRTKDMKPIIIKVPTATPRNAYALHAKTRKAGAMKDRRTERGGQRNTQRLYREEE